MLKKFYASVSVVVVDQVDVVRDRVVEMLRDADQIEQVDGCASVASAKELIAAKSPDIVVADARFSDGTGVELLQWMRERKDCDAQFVALTGITSGLYRERFESLGVQHFVDKAGNLYQLPDLLRKIVASKQAIA